MRKPKPSTTPRKRSRLNAVFSRAKAWVAAQRTVGPHKSFRLTPKSSYRGGEAENLPKVPRTISLLRKSVALIKAQPKTYAALVLIYLSLSWIIIGLPDASQYASVRELLDNLFGEEVRSFQGATALLVGAAGGLLSPAKSDLGQFLTALLSTVFSLCYIWVARQQLAGNETNARQALYNAAAPLVVIAVLLVVMLVQLVPASFGALLLTFTSGIQGAAVVGLEAALMALAAILLIVLSLYLIVPTFLALIIATLPNTYPLEALRSARLLVYRRRLAVMLRLIGITLLLVLIWLLIIIPMIVLELNVPIPRWLPLLQVAIDTASAVTLPIATLFVYQLYRELL